MTGIFQIQIITCLVEGGNYMCGVIGSVLGGLLGSKPKTVSAPAVSAPPTAVDVTSGSDAIDSAKDSKKKAAAAQGYGSTIASGSSGDTSTATTNKKTLLGG